MANTYTQCYIHLIFAVKNRDALIQKTWKNDLEKYMTGIIQNYHHKLLAISAPGDHAHIAIGYNVSHLIPDLVEEVKTGSNLYIRQNHLSPFKFEWQKGYGAFTFSRSQLSQVANYIESQESHHYKKTFREEYLEMLERYDVVYNPEYVFEFFDDIYGP